MGTARSQRPHGTTLPLPRTPSLVFAQHGSPLPRHSARARRFPPLIADGTQWRTALHQ
ncbi:hypothetical protein BV20DRAFT_754577 [Pilatotrama ljubarskyi]|nr:hypothetical protein BV20DRAFT_754577 [Pilatotrama ljubarskyi]